jgi:hypothetical protein
MVFERRVRAFYAACGWRMFDAGALTAPVSAYLEAERALIERLLDESNSRIDRLVELGCGYGRLAPVAARRALRYDGVDLVDWLLDLGRLQAGRCDDVYLHHCSAETLQSVVPKAPAGLAVLPFNFLGNLGHPERCAAELRGLGVSVIVSGFETHAAATAARVDYYQRCGYQMTHVSRVADGVVVAASEGLLSLAYNAGALRDLMQRCGYRAVAQHSLGDVGRATVFVPEADAPASPAHPTAGHTLDRQIWSPPLGGPLTVWSARQGAAGEASLWHFSAFSARSEATHGYRMQVTGPDRIPAGLVGLQCAQAGIRAGVLLHSAPCRDGWRSHIELTMASPGAAGVKEMFVCGT